MIFRGFKNFNQTKFICFVHIFKTQSLSLLKVLTIKINIIIIKL